MRTLRLTTAVAALAAVLITTSGCGKQQPGDELTPAPTTQATTAAPTEPPTPLPPSSTQPGEQPTATGAAAQDPTVISSRVTYQWNWPNGTPASVRHTYTTPPVPALIRIGAGNHPGDAGERPFNRMSFTFTTAMPGYDVVFVDRLVGDANDQSIPLLGRGVLRVTFRQAQAHVADGTRSTVVAKPARYLGMRRMVDYAQAGDYEAVLTYGIGIAWPGAQSNPQIAVRVYEVVRVDTHGQRQYVVAIDVDASAIR